MREANTCSHLGLCKNQARLRLRTSWGSRLWSRRNSHTTSKRERNAPQSLFLYRSMSLFICCGTSKSLLLPDVSAAALALQTLLLSLGLCLSLCETSKLRISKGIKYERRKPRLEKTWEPVSQLERFPRDVIDVKFRLLWLPSSRVWGFGKVWTHQWDQGIKPSSSTVENKGEKNLP